MKQNAVRVATVMFAAALLAGFVWYSHGKAQETQLVAAASQADARIPEGAENLIALLTRGPGGNGPLPRSIYLLPGSKAALVHLTETEPLGLLPYPTVDRPESQSSPGPLWEAARSQGVVSSDVADSRSLLAVFIQVPVEAPRPIPISSRSRMAPPSPLGRTETLDEEGGLRKPEPVYMGGSKSMQVFDNAVAAHVMSQISQILTSHPVRSEEEDSAPLPSEMLLQIPDRGRTWIGAREGKDVLTSIPAPPPPLVSSPLQLQLLDALRPHLRSEPEPRTDLPDPPPVP